MKENDNQVEGKKFLQKADLIPGKYQIGPGNYCRKKANVVPMPP
jgi:hypothetical protein